MASLSDDCRPIIMMVELPEDVIALLFSKLDSMDFHRFGAVCRSWQSITIAAKNRLGFTLRNPLPLLMFSSLKDPYRRLFRLSHNKIMSLELPEIYDSTCVGSNWGWLIMVDWMRRTFLFNPITKVFIELPSQATLPGQSNNSSGPWQPNLINKAILLSPPMLNATHSSESSDYYSGVVIAIYFDQNLAFCKAGDDEWTALGIYFKDIIFYAGKLYAITDKCELKLVDLIRRTKLTNFNIAPPAEVNLERPNCINKKSIYLVECVGELLMVIKSFVIDIRSRGKTMINIFKLDLKARSWIEVKDLDDQMLFIGKSASLSISARDYSGYRRNCVYITPHHDVICSNRGDLYHSYIEYHAAKVTVYHLEDNSFELFPSKHSGCYDLSYCPPIWFTPIFR